MFSFRKINSEPIIALLKYRGGYVLTAFAFGLTLVGVHILGIGLTGTSVNTARSLGPAIVAAISGNAAPIGVIYVFIIGPAIGAVLAALAFKFLDI